MSDLENTQPVGWFDNLGKLINAHKEVVTLVAAFIVFLTFIVQDEVRESLKDVKDSIESAQVSFDNHRDLDIIFEQLENISIIVSDIAASSQKGKTPGDDFQERVFALRFKVFGIKGYNNSLESDLKIVRRLQGVFPIDDKISNLRDKIEKEVTEKKDYIEKSIDKLSPWMLDISKIKNDKDVETALQPYFMDVVNLESEVGIMSAETRNLEEETLARAELSEESSEWWYTLSTYLGGAFFIVGWGLGLAARLSGVDSVEASG